MRTPLPVPFPAHRHANALAMHLAIETKAIEVGLKIAADAPPLDELRARIADYKARGLAWLAGYNQRLLNNLSRDVRLEALMQMESWADLDRDGSAIFIRWYRGDLLAFLDQQQVAA